VTDSRNRPSAWPIGAIVTIENRSGAPAIPNGRSATKTPWRRTRPAGSRVASTTHPAFVAPSSVLIGASDTGAASPIPTVSRVRTKLP